MRADEDIAIIVEDEKDICWAWERILREKGIFARKAISGYEALGWIKSKRFRLVILDAMLPDIDGLELAKRIRKLAPDIRIIMISGYFYQHDPAVQKALKEDMICRFIGKPFRNDEIREAAKVADLY